MICLILLAYTSWKDAAITSHLDFYVGKDARRAISERYFSIKKPNSIK